MRLCAKYCGWDCQEGGDLATWREANLCLKCYVNEHYVLGLKNKLHISRTKKAGSKLRCKEHPYYTGVRSHSSCDSCTVIYQIPKLTSPVILYRIKHKVTGLYCARWGQWQLKGTTWSSLNAVRRYIKRMQRLNLAGVIAAGNTLVDIANNWEILEVREYPIAHSVETIFSKEYIKSIKNASKKYGLIIIEE